MTKVALRVIIETTVANTPFSGETTESQKTIDFLDKSDNLWLRNHIIWCVNNGRKVSIESAR